MITLQEKPLIGIIGGSGIYNLPGLKILDELPKKNKFGQTSEKISIGVLCGKLVAFLPRHGANHTIHPPEIPYEANLLAFKKLGVKAIVATAMCGSLKQDIKPGDAVFPDQFVNFTWGRDHINYLKNELIYLPMAEPYCKTLNTVFSICSNKLKIRSHKKGTVVVIQGPRFSTKAESKWLCQQNWDIINMTQYPEAYFARRMGMHYGTIAMVTDHDIGIKTMNNWTEKNNRKIAKNFKENSDKVNLMLREVILKIPKIFTCTCEQISERAYYKE